MKKLKVVTIPPVNFVLPEETTLWEVVIFSVVIISLVLVVANFVDSECLEDNVEVERSPVIKVIILHTTTFTTIVLL